MQSKKPYKVSGALTLVFRRYVVNRGNIFSVGERDVIRLNSDHGAEATVQATY